MKLGLAVAAAATFMLGAPIQAAPADDALASVRTWLDRFNAGDMDAFYAGHADNAVIIDRREGAANLGAGLRRRRQGPRHHRAADGLCRADPRD